jgi:hypothetical protein
MSLDKNFTFGALQIGRFVFASWPRASCRVNRFATGRIAGG